MSLRCNHPNGAYEEKLLSYGNSLSPSSQKSISAGGSIQVGSAQTTISNSRLWAFDDLSLTEFGRTQMTRISSSGIGISSSW